MLIDEIGSAFQTSTVSKQDEKVQSGEDKKLGRDDFLTLLLAQLKNQDPLNPMDSTEFTSQLAQYSSLEQLFNVNENLEVMRSSQEQNDQYQALSFVDKEVVAEGGILSLEKDGICKGGFTLIESSNCTVFITDSNGYPVRSIPMGVLDSGEHGFQWDGRDGEGNFVQPGMYGFEIAAVNQNGQQLTVDTQIVGRVSSVNLEGDTPLLLVGDIPISLSKVVSVKVPEAPVTP